MYLSTRIYRSVSILFIRSNLFRFLTIGILNTLFGYAAYALFLFLGFSYYVALLLATIAGLIFNYFNFRKFVFSGFRNWSSFYKYIITYFFIYASNVIGLRLLTQDFLLDPYVGQIICIPLSVLFSWILMNHWVFKR